MAETQAEYYARKAREDAERRAAIHEATMQNRKADIGNSPGSFNSSEKQAVDSYFREREDQRRFDESQRTARGQWGFTDADGTHHAGGAEKVAEYGYQGQRDAGATAARINQETSKYNTDMNFQGIEAQAKNALELEKMKQDAAKAIAERNAGVTEESSKREWGYFGQDGTFVPGGRVKQAEAQGEGAAKVAEVNNQAKIEQERIKAAAKVQAQQMMGTDKIKAQVAGNPVMARLLQDRIEAWIAEGKTPQQINEEMAAMQAGTTTQTQTPTWKQRQAQGARDDAARRGLVRGS